MFFAAASHVSTIGGAVEKMVGKMVDKMVGKMVEKMAARSSVVLTLR